MTPSQREPELVELESRLAELVPGASDFDRDRTFFMAGLAAAESSRRRGRAWPAATVIATMLAVTFSSLWLLDGRNASPGAKPVIVDGAGTGAAGSEDRSLAASPLPERVPVKSADSPPRLSSQSYAVVRQQMVDINFDDAPPSLAHGDNSHAESTDVPSTRPMLWRPGRHDWNL